MTMPGSPEVEILRVRVERLERWMRIVVVGSVLSVAVFMLLGVAAQQTVSQSEVLRARRIEVVDTTGRPRMVLALSPQDGSPALVMLNAAGRTRVSLAILPRGASGLVVSDAAGRERISLSSVPSGGAGLALLNVTGGTRAMFTTLPSGPPVLVLYNAEGGVLFQAP